MHNAVSVGAAEVALLPKEVLEVAPILEQDRMSRQVIGIRSRMKLDIVGYESPKSKTNVTGVRMLTKDGFRFVRIAGYFGPNRNRKDVYSFIMLLRALIPGTPIVSFSSS